MQCVEFEPATEGEVSSEFIPRQAPPPQVKPGDFLLSLASPWRHRFIRLGQRLRIHGDDRARYTGWTHAALVVSEDGEIIEAVGSGVQTSHISAYQQDNSPYHVVHLDASDEDRKQIVEFARWVLAKGAQYNRLAIVSIGLSILTGSKFVFFTDGEFHCSGLVARALERTNAKFTFDPVHIMPADLAKYFKVPPPPEPVGSGTGPVWPPFARRVAALAGV